ncbi:hypothetical protein BJ741DRAFT_163943 [Chytriomyces cf. hyalinus JEL632]|nr:hypothetical protein BJ741DRAFT_163943 [Chytriomyces cf. hyalinus JEL632]
MRTKFHRVPTLWAHGFMVREWIFYHFSACCGALEAVIRVYSKVSMCEGSNGRGCSNEWQAWDEEMMAKYPSQVQHEFPFIITPKWMITKELLNFILVSQHVMGMSQIYRMLRAMYFHTFLTDMHVYSDHLKQYARSIRRTQSPAEAAAFLKTHVPLIGKHSSTLFELCTNTYRHDGAWPSLDFLDEVCRKQFERVIKPIADRVQSSVSAEYLAFDTTKKITSKVQVNGCPVFGGLEIACNEYHEIPHWAFRTSEDSVEFERSVKSLIHCLKGFGCKLKGIFLDNCCTWGDVFRRVFSSLLEDEQKPQIFLDCAHFLMRFTEAAKKDSPLWDSFRRDLSTAVCYSRRAGPNEGGSFSDIKKSNSSELRAASKRRSDTRGSWQSPGSVGKAARQSKYMNPVSAMPNSPVLPEGSLV